MKKIKIIIVGIMSVLLFTACAKVNTNMLERVVSKGKLTLAVSPDYPPYEFYEGKNGKVEIVGADIALSKSIAEKIGVTLEVVPLSFDSLLPALTSNRVDMVISGMNPTPERKSVVDFSNIYYVGGSSFIIRKDSVDISSTTDLKDKKIAVQKGSIQETFLLDELQIDRDNLHSLSDVTNVLQVLKNKQVDAVFLAEDVSKISLAHQDELVLSQFRLEKDAESDGMAIAFKKGDNQSLLNVVNEVIDDYNRSNQFEKELEYFANIVGENKE